MKGVVAIAAIAVAIVDLTGCAVFRHLQFTQPANDWQTRSGQLMYRSRKAKLIGDVFLRFSKAGDFELTFSKGPGVNLLVIKQNNTFAEVKGALAKIGWSGPVDHAPKQLRGWLQLREKLMAAQDQQTVRSVSGSETFLFRF